MSRQEILGVDRGPVTALTAIVPAFNEEEALATAVTAIRANLRELDVPFEIVIVNDGSTDGTARIAEQFAADDRSIVVVHHERNRRIGAALKTGAEQPADLGPIYELARGRGLAVIEDCCQAYGAEYHGTRVPVGETGCFSFYPGKNLGCFGDGSAVVTDSETIADRIRVLRNDGSRTKYYHESIGFKSRLDTLQVVVLLEKLRHLEHWNDRRRAWAARYRDVLDGVVGLPHEMPYARHVYHLCMIIVADRDALQAYLHGWGISTVLHYPVPIHLQAAYASLGHKPGDFPVAERLARSVLSLPMFPELQADEVEYVAAAVERHQQG